MAHRKPEPLRGATADPDAGAEAVAVNVEAVDLGAAAAVAVAAALFKAAKKSGRAWVGDPPRLLWCAWYDDSIALVAGGPEQGAQLTDGAEVSVVLTDSGGASSLRLHCRATIVEAADAEWPAIASLLAQRRLNGAAGPAELAARWATEAVVWRLFVVGGKLL